MRLEFYEIKLPRRLTAKEKDKLIKRCQQHYLSQMEKKEG
jgi:phenylpyruvate tautomerase PptA (4-oxalocrotonate tautomerase family)